MNFFLRCSWFLLTLSVMLEGNMSFKNVNCWLLLRNFFHSVMQMRLLRNTDFRSAKLKNSRKIFK